MDFIDATFAPIRSGAKSEFACDPNSTAPSVLFAFCGLLIKRSSAATRRRWESVDDIDPESSTIASTLVTGLQAVIARRAEVPLGTATMDAASSAIAPAPTSVLK